MAKTSSTSNVNSASNATSNPVLLSYSALVNQKLSDKAIAELSLLNITVSKNNESDEGKAIIY